jgi:hypothetical protein
MAVLLMIGKIGGDGEDGDGTENCQFWFSTDTFLLYKDTVS